MDDVLLHLRAPVAAEVAADRAGKGLGGVGGSGVAAGLMRRPWGVTLGWVVQALTLLSALVVPMMLVVGLFFLALWVTCLVKGAQIDAEMARREAAAGVGEGPSGAEGAADRVDG